MPTGQNRKIVGRGALAIGKQNGLWVAFRVSSLKCMAGAVVNGLRQVTTPVLRGKDQQSYLQKSVMTLTYGVLMTKPDMAGMREMRAPATARNFIAILSKGGGGLRWDK
jgi:hypothetical protein